MVARAADADGRRVERVEPVGEPPRQLVAEHRVGAERQVMAVLLDRAERDHDRVAAGSISCRTSGQVSV